MGQKRAVGEQRFEQAPAGGIIGQAAREGRRIGLVQPIALLLPML
jgi:hypothetical protein